MDEKQAYNQKLSQFLSDPMDADELAMLEKHAIDDVVQTVLTSLVVYFIRKMMPEDEKKQFIENGLDRYRTNCMKSFQDCADQTIQNIFQPDVDEFVSQLDKNIGIAKIKLMEILAA